MLLAARWVRIGSESMEAARGRSGRVFGPESADDPSLFAAACLHHDQGRRRPHSHGQGRRYSHGQGLMVRLEITPLLIAGMFHVKRPSGPGGGR